MNNVVQSVIVARVGAALLPKALQKDKLAENWINPFKRSTPRTKPLPVKKMGPLLTVSIFIIMITGMVALPILAVHGEGEPRLFQIILAFWSLIAGPIFMMTVLNTIIHLIPSWRYSYHADALQNSFKLSSSKAPDLNEIALNYDLDALSKHSLKRSLLGSFVLLIPTIPLVLLAWL